MVKLIAECRHCRESKKIMAKGLCAKCYFREYRRVGIEEILDDSVEIRTEARRSFFQKLKDLILRKIQRTEVADLPSEWIEKNVRIPPSTSARRDGRVHWDITPDSVFIVDLAKNPNVRKITLAFSAQSGKSLILQTLCAYLAYVRRDSIVYGLPSVSLLKSVPVTRFDPLFELTRIPTKKNRGVTFFEDKNSLQFVLLTSRDQLAEKTSRVVVVDEIGEAGELDFDPVAELEERQRIYDDSLLIEATTPKNPGKDVLLSLENSKQFEIEWPCPFCGEFFHTELDDIKVKKRIDDPEQQEIALEGEIVSDDGTTMAPTTIRENESGCIYCPHCGCEIGDEYHQKMVRKQRWKCLTPELSMVHVGFRKAVWNTIFKDFTAVLAKKIQSAKDPLLWQQFRANWCADPVDMSVESASSITSISRGEYLRGRPPKDSIGWVFGIDAGKHELWISCVAVSPRGYHQFFSQRIDRDKNDPDAQKRALMHLILDREWSGKLPYLGCSLDTGYDQKEMLDLSRSIPLCVPIKGDGTSVVGPYTITKAEGIYLLNHAYWQDYFQSDVNRGKMQTPKNAYSWVETHWKNEIRKTETNQKTGLPHQYWALRYEHAPNHLRDASIYAEFRLYLLGLSNIKVAPSKQSAELTSVKETIGAAPQAIPSRMNQGVSSQNRRLTPLPVRGLGGQTKRDRR